MSQITDAGPPEYRRPFVSVTAEGELEVDTSMRSRNAGEGSDLDGRIVSANEEQYERLHKLLQVADKQSEAFQGEKVKPRHLSQSCSRVASDMAAALKEMGETMKADPETTTWYRDVKTAFEERSLALKGNHRYSVEEQMDDKDMWADLEKGIFSRLNELDAQYDSFVREYGCHAHGLDTTHVFSEHSASQALQILPSAARRNSRRSQSHYRLQRQPDGSLEMHWKGERLRISGRHH